MQPAKVNQRTKSFDVRPEQLGQRNVFDLSHDHKTTFTMGALVPFLTLETLPGDTFRINGEFMLRFAPLYLPIMHRVNMSVDYFYITNRILWPNYGPYSGVINDGWEAFISRDVAIEHPYATIPVSTTGASLAEYMGFPTKLLTTGSDISSIDVNCFPISAYLKIWDEWYRNDQIQDERWFPLVAGDNTAVFVANGYGWGLFRRNWNRDYYTSETPTPQVGANVLVPMIRSNDVDTGTWTHLGPTNWKLFDNTAAPNGNLETDASGGTRVNNAGLQPAYLDVQETAATVRDLRYAVMLTEYLERLMRAGDRYRDNLKTFWDVDPDPLKIDRPVFIGGKKGKVVVSEVLSTAETVNGSDTVTSYVGSYAGQALALDSIDNTIEYFCMDYGFIIGLISVYPQSSYMQGLERMWTRDDKYSYAWEQFALIGDDEVKNKEVRLAFQTGKQTFNEGIFGYVPRYSEYRYKNDIVSGLMRTTFLSFHMARVLDPAVDMYLNDSFIQCEPRITDVFQVAEGEDEIYAHIYNEVTVLRRLPKFGIPAL